MIIVNYKLWLLIHVILPTLAITLTISIMVANIIMLIQFVIKRRRKRKKGVCVMNKRQAKKAFKKKYGVNPNQAGKALLNFDWYKFGQDLGKAINDVLNAIAQAFNIAAEKLRAYEEGRENGTITITGEKVLLDMWDDTKPTQTPCNTREEKQSKFK